VASAAVLVALGLSTPAYATSASSYSCSSLSWSIGQEDPSWAAGMPGGPAASGSGSGTCWTGTNQGASHTVAFSLSGHYDGGASGQWSGSDLRWVGTVTITDGSASYPTNGVLDNPVNEGAPFGLNYTGAGTVTLASGQVGPVETNWTYSTGNGPFAHPPDACWLGDISYTLEGLNVTSGGFTA